jgi:hypothetical protein
MFFDYCQFGRLGSIHRLQSAILVAALESLLSRFQFGSFEPLTHVFHRFVLLFRRDFGQLLLEGADSRR